MGVEWDKSTIVRLIKALEVRPAIWDLNSNDYRDKHKRRQCFNELALAFNCSRTDIEKKISNLRTQYGKEVCKMAKSEAGGEFYRTKWFAFKHLTFLKRKELNLFKKSLSSTARKHDQRPVKHRELSVEIKVEQDMTDGNCDSNISRELISLEELQNNYNAQQLCSSSSTVSDEQTCFVESTTPKITHVVGFSSQEQIQRKTLETASSIEPIQNASLGDEYDIFGQSIAVQLRNLSDPYARSVAKFNIQKALFEAETGSYSNCIQNN